MDTSSTPGNGEYKTHRDLDSHVVKYSASDILKEIDEENQIF